ncbi:hypothetical protein [Mucilaginibacter sp. HD30]
MKKLLTAVFCLLVKCSTAQVLVFDPVTSGAIAVNAGIINGKLNDTNDKLDLIQKGQLTVSAQLLVINDLQSKIYTGLSQVSSVINNLTTIKEIAECGNDIVTDVVSSVQLARANPLLLLFAEQGARDFQTRAATLAAEVSAFVLKGGNANLMDAGERAKLLNHIAQEMRILRGIAYGMNRSMYWAKINGIFRSLNPWAEWQNQDVRIANDILTNARYLKR